MTSDELKKSMLDYAAEMRKLHSRIRNTFKHRSESSAKLMEWEHASKEFHASYDKKWPIKYDFEEWLVAISEGEPEAIEAGLCFLECRPYFFRSGYMFKDILRKCKRAPMSAEHGERLKIILEKWAVYRKARLRHGQ